MEREPWMSEDYDPESWKQEGGAWGAGEEIPRPREYPWRRKGPVDMSEPEGSPPPPAPAPPPNEVAFPREFRAATHILTETSLPASLGRTYVDWRDGRIDIEGLLERGSTLNAWEYILVQAAVELYGGKPRVSLSALTQFRPSDMNVVFEAVKIATSSS